jgi:hypothetical protein
LAVQSPSYFTLEKEKFLSPIHRRENKNKQVKHNKEFEIFGAKVGRKDLSVKEPV